MDMENPATKIFKSNVNFVYDELIKQFINNKGNCLESTFCLINWGYILDSNNNEGLKESLDGKTVYKLYISYLTGLLSKYLKYNDTSLLIHLFSYSVSFNFSISSDFKRIFYKRMANIIQIDPNGRNSKELKNILMNQDIVENIVNYSSEDFYDDICIILEQAKYLNEKLLIKAVFNFFDQNYEENKAVELIETSLMIAKRDHELKLGDLTQVDRRKSNKDYVSNKNISSSLALTEDGLVSIESIMNETVSNDKTPFGSPITVKEEVKNESLEKKKSLRKRNNSKSNDEIRQTKRKIDGQIIEPKKEKKFKYHGLWTEEETSKLFAGVAEYDKDWEKIHEKYKSVFKDRTSHALLVKYDRLRRNHPEKFKEYTKQFKLSENREINESNIEIKFEN